MRVDFSLVVVDAPAGTERHAYAISEEFYWPPDCDHAPVPLPPGGTVERWPPAESLAGLAGYECPDFDDGADCHLLVFAPAESRLYELYHFTRRPSGALEGGCLAIWPTDRPVMDGRGQHCTSADVAGFPIAPLLVRPEEVAAGEVSHALRFILPNPMIRRRQMVPPATHAAGSGDDPDGVPYGALFRLRADYPLDDLAPAARVVARAMMQHGMYLADGGNLALTFAADTLSAQKWDALGLGPGSFAALRATDFEVVDTGPEAYDTWDCRRSPIAE
jgi:serine/threonine-protein kinase